MRTRSGPTGHDATTLGATLADPSETAAPRLPVPLGSTIAFKYRVERVIGAGGMGVVLAAWHLQLNQRVALKFISPALARDAEATTRFAREARAAARLQSVHVGKVLDLDALPDGTPFVVMEHLEGESLEARLARERTVPVAQALVWTRQALIALAEAHACGTVHRDVKPGNLFLARRADGSELVKLLDFGIASSVDPQVELGLGPASTRFLMGSPPYLPPELMGPSAALDPRADLWSLGVVLYQLLSGRLPFEEENVLALLEAIRSRAPRPLQQVAPGLPQSVLELVARCLQKEPAARFASANAMREAVDAALGSSLAGTQPARRQPAVRSSVAVLLFTVSLLAGALGAGLFSSRGPPSPPRAAELPPKPAPRASEAALHGSVEEAALAASLRAPERLPQEPAREGPQSELREAVPAGVDASPHDGQSAPAGTQTQEDDLSPLPGPAPRRPRPPSAAPEPEFDERR